MEVEEKVEIVPKTIEFEYLSTSIQFSKDEVEYHVEYLSYIE